MPSSYTLGQHFEAFIQEQLASGRYNNASEVVREALRLMEKQHEQKEERKQRLATLDAALMQGIADVEAGRVYDAEDVFKELIAEIEALPDRPVV